MHSIKRQDHPTHSYARLVKFQEWMTWLTVPIALLCIGAAVVFGLFTSTGHVTW
jgi:hypothetical protein